MTEPIGPLVALVGMPDTGKTTFVAALWNLIQDPTANSSIRLKLLPKEAAYLNEIQKAWIGGRIVGHTSRGSGELIRLDIAVSGRDVVLELPDASGESFEDMFIERQVETEIDELLVRADGFILFIHPAQLRPRVTILDAHRMGVKPGKAEDKTGRAKGQQTLVDAPVVAEPAELKTEEVSGRNARKKTPSEVQAVDLLQTIRLRRVAARTTTSETRLAILISAWDEIANEAMPPTRWLAARMPLLHQYLEATSRGQPFHIYGVSAQGGSYGDPGLAAVDPAKRAFIVEPDGRVEHDLSVPVAWVVGNK
jgi:double-GTPase-like protein